MDAYEEALHLNLLSTVAMCRQAVPGMQERGWGRVVAITSIGAKQPIGNLAASTTARTGVTGFLKVLALGVPGEVYNIGTPEPEISVLDLVSRIRRILDRDVAHDLIEHPDSYPADEPMRRCPDIRKAQLQLASVYEHGDRFDLALQHVDRSIEKMPVCCLKLLLYLPDKQDDEARSYG